MEASTIRASHRCSSLGASIIMKMLHYVHSLITFRDFLCLVCFVNFQLFLEGLPLPWRDCHNLLDAQTSLDVDVFQLTKVVPDDLQLNLSHLVHKHCFVFPIMYAHSLSKACVFKCPDSKFCHCC